MCRSQADGGQRCAAHSLERMNRAAERVKAASAAGDAQERSRQSEKWERAAVQYAATSSGREAVTGWRAEAAAAGAERAVGRWDSILRRGAELRASQAATRTASTSPASVPGGASETTRTDPWAAIDAERAAAASVAAPESEHSGASQGTEASAPASYPLPPATWLKLDKDHPRVSGAFAAERGLWEGRRVAVEYMARRGHSRRRTDMRVVYGTLVHAPNGPDRPDQIGVRGPGGGMAVIHVNRAKTVFDLSRRKPANRSGQGESTD